MNEAIVERFNSVVDNDDDLYLLGDVLMGELEDSMEYLKRLNGRIHIICGNHCTPRRIEAYKTLPSIVEVEETATKVKYRKWIFYVSHWPTLVSNFEERRKFWSLHGHTHSPDRFQFAQQCAYNVACDAHNCYPVAIEDIIADIYRYTEENIETV
jgi:calcineurin-like phosphoesterase family protein